MIITRAERKRRKLAAAGSKGGNATGVCKVRGDSEYYRRIRAMRKISG